MLNEFNEYVRDCFSEAGDITKQLIFQLISHILLSGKSH